MFAAQLAPFDALVLLGGALPGGYSVRPGQPLGRRKEGVFGENTRFFLYIVNLRHTALAQLSVPIKPAETSKTAIARS